jgi:hypothetical protein
MLQLHAPSRKLVVQYGSGTGDVRGRRSLAEEEIADLFSDELSDVPSSTSTGSDTVSGSDGRTNKCGPYQ